MIAVRIHAWEILYINRMVDMLEWRQEIATSPKNMDSRSSLRVPDGRNER